MNKTSVSELLHLVSLRARSSQKLETGMLIISIDVDVGCKDLGTINEGKNDSNISPRHSEFLVGQIEEEAFPIFIDLFNDFEIPATFAMRGQLAELSNSFRELFRRSTVDHDIGAHGYFHRQFNSLNAAEAEGELLKIQTGMRNLGIVPRSFVFPKNRVAYLDLLEKYGYKCYRSRGGFTRDCMRISKEGALFNVHPSLFITKDANPQMLKRILNISVKRRLPFHVWFHLWDFGQNQDDISRCVNRIFRPLFDYAKKREQSGILTCATMLSAMQNLKTE